MKQFFRLPSPVAKRTGVNVATYVLFNTFVFALAVVALSGGVTLFIGLAASSTLFPSNFGFSFGLVLMVASCAGSLKGPRTLRCFLDRMPLRAELILRSSYTWGALHILKLATGLALTILSLLHG